MRATDADEGLCRKRYAVYQQSAAAVRALSRCMRVTVVDVRGDRGAVNARLRSALRG